MPFIDGYHHQIYYRRWSVDQPRARVLLLHGYGEHTGHYHRLAYALNAQGFEVFGPDHLGHGHTGGTPPGYFPSVAELAENAAILVDHVERQGPQLPIAIVGHSLGALAGALLAITSPTKWTSLVMTGAPLWGLPDTVAGESDPIMSRDEAYLDALANDPLEFDTEAAEDNLWACISLAGSKVRCSLPALGLPILLINGEYDVFAPADQAREFAGELMSGRAVSIPLGYHDIPNDRAHAEVAREIACTISESIPVLISR
ncbi:alpha/beta fold hydrolase [Gordonia sp. NPDC003424]